MNIYYSAIIVCVLSISSVYAVEPASLPSIRIGDVEIVTIQDGPNSFPADLFTNIDPVDLKRCMPEGKAPGATNTFLLKLKNGERVLIDTGNGTHDGFSPELLPNLARAGVKPADVSMVLLTHMHCDHIGGLIENGKRVFPKAKIRCSKMEYEYWTNGESFETLRKTIPEGDVPYMKGMFDLVAEIIKIYGEDFLPPFEFGDKPIASLDALTALNAVGHTPGHTVFQIEFDGRRFLIIGDMLHVVTLQFSHPEAYTRFDMNSADTLKTRRRFLDRAVDENIPIGGMHFPTPGIGHVKRNDKNSYIFIPMNL